jgi:membrane fusion protein, multidrug efflux system
MRLINIMAITLSLAALYLAACTGNRDGAAGTPPRPPTPVTVTTAVSRDVPEYLDEIGTTQASAVVNIQSQVAGQITARHFEDGQEIAKDALLFEIDPRPFQDQVKQAQANLEQARAQLVIAQGEFDRIMKAVTKGAASPEDVSGKESALNSAKAAVKVNEAALNTTQLNLSYCTIRSPIDGRAGRRLVDVGNLVKANDATLLTIQTLAPLYADFTVTEADLAAVRERMAKGTLKAEVSIPGRLNEVRPGDLTFLDTQVQPNAGRIIMRATLANTERYFWPGQFVNVRLILVQIPHAVLVPYACVEIAQQGPYVYVVSEGKARQQPVSLGQRQGDLVVIQKGITVGEEIVATGQLAVTPGGPVRILETPATSPAVAAGMGAEGRP